MLLPQLLILRFQSADRKKAEEQKCYDRDANSWLKMKNWNKQIKIKLKNERQFDLI